MSQLQEWPLMIRLILWYGLSQTATVTSLTSPRSLFMRFHLIDTISRAMRQRRNLCWSCSSLSNSNWGDGNWQPLHSEKLERAREPKTEMVRDDTGSIYPVYYHESYLNGLLLVLFTVYHVTSRMATDFFCLLSDAWLFINIGSLHILNSSYIVTTIIYLLSPVAS